MAASSTKVWDKLVADIAGIAKRVVKIGVPSGPQVEIAAYQEFGTNTAEGEQLLPPRPFISSTFIAKRSELAKMCERAAKTIVTRGMPVDQALALVGAWGAAAVKKTITDNQVQPPDTQTTIDRKGSSTTLVDDGDLVKAITYVVGERES